MPPKPCRTKWVYLEGGIKARQSKRSGQVIAKNDFVLRQRTAPVTEGPHDTPADAATRSSFR